jgi:propanediol dehydratase small subunit
VRDFDPVTDYPLGLRRADLVRTPSGLALDELTLDAARTRSMRASDLRATRATLERQAAVAAASGRPPLAENLGRAAELTAVPDDVVLEVYTALRPRRASAAQLEAMAARLEADFDAPGAAAFVREAAAAYADRGLLG